MNGRKIMRAGGVAAIAATLAVFVLAGTVDAGKHDKDRGYLGVYMQELSADVKDGLDLKVDAGVLISGIIDDSPAAEAGLEDGDVIILFDGKEVTSPDDLRDLVRATAPGTSVEVKLVRDGKNKTLTLEIGDRPEDFWFSLDNDRPGNFEIARFIGGAVLGVEATELNEGLAEYFDTKAESGVLVLDVKEETVAAAAGVEAGDVILKIDDEKVTSVKDLRESLRDYEEGDDFSIGVLRHGKSQTLKATMDAQHAFRVWNGRMPHMQFSPKHFRMPQMRMERFGSDMREELDELRRDLDELRKELKGKS